MRYTTIIDITEIPEIYRNINARLIYLHMVLKSGYHDTDRDRTTLSIRSLASDTGITISATRHALSILQKAQLLSRTGDTWIVKKWLIQDTISARPKSSYNTVAADPQEVARKKAEEQEQFIRKVCRVLDGMTIEQVNQWAQELRSGKSLRHGGIQIKAIEENAKWIENYKRRA